MSFRRIRKSFACHPPPAAAPLSVVIIVAGRLTSLHDSMELRIVIIEIICIN